jgi:hypothetical protein
MKGSSGKTTAEMAEILEYMVDDFDHFKTAAIPDKTSICFPRKCELIQHEVLQLIQRLKSSPNLGLETEEITAYIRSAILRLSIDLATDSDAKNEVDRFARIHQHNVWDMPKLGWTKEAEGLRTRLWTVYTNVNFLSAGCKCEQCEQYWWNGRQPRASLSTLDLHE